MLVQWPAVRKKFGAPLRTLKPSEQRAELVRIASPPLIRCVTGALSVSTRAAEPARLAAALSALTAAPLAPAGSESTTWLVTGSTPQAEPTTRGAVRNDAWTPASCAALCATSFGVAPDGPDRGRGRLVGDVDDQLAGGVDVAADGLRAECLGQGDALHVRGGGGGSCGTRGGRSRLSGGRGEGRDHGQTECAGERGPAEH